MTFFVSQDVANFRCLAGSTSAGLEPCLVIPATEAAFVGRAEVRVLVTPPEAAVYVDGYYAGLVDDLDGFFQRLPLTPSVAQRESEHRGQGLIATARS